MEGKNRRADFGWLRVVCCGVVRFAVRVSMRIYFRLRIINPPKLSGGYVVVANHASLMDPMVLAAVNPRRVQFLMNSVSFRSPLLGWLYRLFRAIPVAPSGGNRQAMRDAHAALDAGEVVGVFPEGGVSRDRGLLLGHPGAVAMVLSRNTPVVPVGLVGVGDALPYGAGVPRPKKIEVRYGDPISAAELMGGDDRKERLARATRLIMREIANLTGQVSREDQMLKQIH